MAKFLGGVDEMARALALLNKDERGRILKDVAKQDPALCERIIQKLVSLNDLVLLSPKMMSYFLSQVELLKLGQALKLYPQDLREHLYMRVSTRMAQELKQIIEVDKIPASKAQESHLHIMSILRKLIDEGKIVIRKDDEEIV